MFNTMDAVSSQESVRVVEVVVCEVLPFYEESRLIVDSVEAWIEQRIPGSAGQKKTPHLYPRFAFYMTL